VGGAAPNTRRGAAGAAPGGAGRDGNDTLVGGTQNDNLTGGAGADVFLFNVGDGADIIMDWEDGLDRIDISAYGLASFGDVLAAASDLPIGAVRIDLGGGNTIQINGFTTADLDASDVIF
jgi:Ca2+-binding RTX toxin-like protein